jgi:PAS domain S-box-containing protein
MLGIGEDITERKFAEHATKQAERELRLLAFTLNCAKDSFCITDLENNILFVNQSFLDTYGYSEEELSGQNIEMLRSASVPPDIPEQIRAKTREGGWSGEIMNRRKDGSDFPIELWTSVVRNDAGDPVALVGVARDITDRKRAEDRIQASLREKEVLLKEIHHRVKNNLQVIASLLNLQAATIRDEHTLTVFKESQNRVKSMSLVHQELYQSEDLARIDFAEYIRKLTTNLLLSYGVDSLAIELKRRVSDVYLTVDTAIPCGLIINELVSNSLKYAFPDGKKGEIGVTFHNSDEQYTLTVSDNGVGFPKNLDFRKTESLGLQLVNTLTRQLRGSIELDTSNGTAFTLIFGEKEKAGIAPGIDSER